MGIRRLVPRVRRYKNTENKHYLPNAVLTRRISVFFLKLPAEIVDRIESAGITDLLKRHTFVIQQSECYLQPVLNQSVNGRAAHVGVEAASRFATTDIG